MITQLMGFILEYALIVAGAACLAVHRRAARVVFKKLVDILKAEELC